MNASPELLWLATRNNSAFVRKDKKTGVTFSTEPQNLRNVHSFRHSGLVQKRAVGIQAGATGGIVMTLKRKTAKRNPAKALVASHFAKPHGFRRIAAGIVKSTRKSHYRRDLKKDALARASALYAAQQRKPDPASLVKKLRGKKAKAAAAASATTEA